MNVPITTDRKVQILGNVERMAQQDLAATLPEFQPVSSVDASELLTRLSLWPQPTLYDAIPHDWLSSMSESERVIILYREGETPYVHDSKRLGWAQDYNKDALWEAWWNFPTVVASRYSRVQDHVMYAKRPLYIAFPKSARALERPTSNSRVEVTTPMLTPERLAAIRADYPGLPGLAEVDALLAVADEAIALRDRWLAVHAQVRTLLDSVKTLNQAVKVVPELRGYMPQPLLDQLDKKAAPRSAPTQVEVGELDRALLASTAVAQRLLSGS